MLGQASLFAGMTTSAGVDLDTYTLTGSDEEFDDKQIQAFEKDLNPKIIFSLVLKSCGFYNKMYHHSESQVFIKSTFQHVF